jgi:peptidoglycan hydrolase-like protein with peptidoglycan-binding domain
VRNLRQGIGRLDVPQGVTVLRGAPRAVKTEINDAILAPGANVVGSGVANRCVTVLGYRPRDLVMQTDTANAQPAPVAPRASIVDRVRENAVWTDAQSRDTVAAYQSYLQTYPRGVYVQAAQDAIEAIQSEPNCAACLREEALNLTRDQRRDVQCNLTLLEFDTRGIDGIFGRGSRAAIAAWQAEYGFDQTTYLTQRQIRRIDDQAKVRAQELEQ